MTRLLEILTNAEYTTAATVFRLCNPSTDAHHPMGPSGLLRVERCPASMLAGIVCRRPDDAAGKDADDGTRRHELLASIGHGCGELPEHSEADARHVEYGRAVIKQVESELREAANGQQIVCWTEVPLEAKGVTFGRADYLGIGGKRGFLLDWKTGRCAEESFASTLRQLEAYAAMAVLSHGLTSCSFAAVYTDSQRIECQGLISSRIEAEEVIKEIARARDIALSPEAPFANDGGDGVYWCKYCPVAAAGRCPTMQAAAAAAAAQISPDAMVIAQTVALQTVADADALLCRWDEFMAYAGPKIDAAKALIKEAGGSDHFSVVPVKGRTTTNWKGLVKAHGIQPAEIAEYETVGEPSIQIRRRK